MNRIREVDEVLRALVGRHSILSAILASDDGEVVAVHPAPGEAEEASETARWAAEQIEWLSGARAQLPREEFSVLFDPKEVGPPRHCHLQPVRDYVLVLLFRERDSLAGVRQASKAAFQELDLLLTPES